MSLDVLRSGMANTLPRKLRHNSTEAEKIIWRALRSRQLDGHKFRRQHPIGKFVADFCCAEAMLIVEIDGGQHAADEERDAARTAYLGSKGYRVVRFWNNEVLENLEGVLTVLRQELTGRE